MLHICLRDVMDVVCSVVLKGVELQLLVYRKCARFLLQMLYVCVLCASCGSSQCFVLHDLQFVILVGDEEATIWKSHTPEPVS